LFKNWSFAKRGSKSGCALCADLYSKGSSSKKHCSTCPSITGIYDSADESVSYAFMTTVDDSRLFVEYICHVLGSSEMSVGDVLDKPTHVLDVAMTTVKKLEGDGNVPYVVSERYELYSPDMVSVSSSIHHDS
jgi:hypothetical protein